MFIFVYIREAHPSDGWQVPQNKKEGVVIETPKTEAEKQNVAKQCVIRLNLDMLTLVDSMDDTTAKAYGAWPDRLYLINTDGTVFYKSGPGPWGFKPDEIEKYLHPQCIQPSFRKPKHGKQNICVQNNPELFTSFLFIGLKRAQNFATELATEFIQ